jgi:pyruvate dehydrogenase E2 component (dihydrolipoamide acetyltransferase)
MHPIIMPQVGQDIPSARIIEWRKEPGEGVRRGEVVLVVESDKASFEVESDADGVLLGRLYEEDAEVEILKVLAYVGEPGERIPEEALEPAGPGSRDGTADRVPVPAGPTEVAAAPDRPAASPSARRIAREHGIDLGQVEGSGTGGRIVKRDVLQAAQEGGDTPVPFSKLRKRLAERLTQSVRTIPHFYISVDVDVTPGLKWRDEFNARTGQHVTVTDMVIRAAALSLTEFPRLNAHVSDTGITLKAEVNVGVAVALDDGLLVPVIPRADTADLVEISRMASENAEGARRGVLSRPEVGTFTVSSLGMCHVKRFLPIINPPECAILAVGTALKRAMPMEAGVRVRDVMTLTLGCDHRAVDGMYAAAFLNRAREYLEDPPRLAAGVSYGDYRNQQSNGDG